MTPLDLDALEQRQTDPNNDPHFNFAMMTKAEAIDLIQRVREAESALAFAATDSSRLNVALDSAVRFNGAKNRIIETLEGRVAQLDRVREAAAYYQERHDASRRGVVVRDMDEAQEALRAAIAAVREATQ